MREALGVLELVIKRDAVSELQAFETGAGRSNNGDKKNKRNKQRKFTNERR